MLSSVFLCFSQSLERCKNEIVHVLSQRERSFGALFFFFKPEAIDTSRLSCRSCRLSPFSEVAVGALGMIASRRRMQQTLKKSRVKVARYVPKRLGGVQFNTICVYEIIFSMFIYPSTVFIYDPLGGINIALPHKLILRCTLTSGHLPVNKFLHKSSRINTTQENKKYA